MLTARLRWMLSLVAAFSAATATLVAVAGTANPVFDLDRLREVAAHLRQQTGGPVKAHLAPKGAGLVLVVRYVPGAEERASEARLARQMDRLLEQAVIRYVGFVDEVTIRAVSPEEFLGLAGGGAPSRTNRLAELLGRLDRQGVLAYGDYHWPVKVRACRDWRYVLIHHSAADLGSAETIGRWHRRGRHWDALGYQFVIGNGRGSGDGQIEVGERWLYQQVGAHAGVNKLRKSDAEKNKYNEEAVGICLVGNFYSPAGGTGPTEMQMESLRVLTLYLLLKFDLRADAVLGHGDVAMTDCPGDLFPLRQFRAEVRRDLARLEALR